MPASSEDQKTLACIALSMLDGETERSYSEQAAKMADTMTREELEHYCKEPVEKG